MCVRCLSTRAIQRNESAAYSSNQLLLYRSYPTRLSSTLIALGSSLSCARLLARCVCVQWKRSSARNTPRQAYGSADWLSAVTDRFARRSIGAPRAKRGKYSTRSAGKLRGAKRTASADNTAPRIRRLFPRASAGKGIGMATRKGVSVVNIIITAWWPNSHVSWSVARAVRSDGASRLEPEDSSPVIRFDWGDVELACVGLY